MRHPIVSRLSLLLILLACCSCERNEYSLPGRIIDFHYASNQIGGWDKVFFEAYDERIDDRLVWAVGLVSNNGVDDVSIAWGDQQFDLAHLSDEDITELEGYGVDFTYSPGDDIEKLQFRSFGEYNPNIRLYVTFLDGKVTHIALISRGYPDPASGDVQMPPIRILMGTGEAIAIPTQEQTLLETFGPWESESRSTHH